jgi:hypothetical protein
MIELDKVARRLVVEDTLEMEEAHEVELFFHFSERCAVEIAEGAWIATHGPVAVRVMLPELAGAEARLMHGSVAPIGGWVSRGFDRRVPAPTLVWRARVPGGTVLATTLEIRRAG